MCFIEYNCLRIARLQIIKPRTQNIIVDDRDFGCARKLPSLGGPSSFQHNRPHLQLFGRFFFPNVFDRRRTNHHGGQGLGVAMQIPKYDQSFSKAHVKTDQRTAVERLLDFVDGILLILFKSVASHQPPFNMAANAPGSSWLTKHRGTSTCPASNNMSRVPFELSMSSWNANTKLGWPS